jgi:hypothetical protein
LPEGLTLKFFELLQSGQPLADLFVRFVEVMVLLAELDDLLTEWLVLRSQRGPVGQQTLDSCIARIGVQAGIPEGTTRFRI